MIITDELLEEITDYASHFLSPREIAVLMDIAIPDFLTEIQNHRSQVYLAYFKGKTKSKFEIRQKVVSLAKMGSPQAELMCEKFIEDQLLEEDHA